MSVTDNKVVDAITLEKESRRLVLRIFDHLSWDDDIIETHLIALQEKLNDYMDYIISKQYEELYNPEAYDKIVIKIIAKNSFSNEGIRCLNIARNIIVNAGYYLEWETSSEGESSQNE